VKVKICGIFETDSLEKMQDKKVWPDYIGFVFTQSRRQVSKEQVTEWKSLIPSHVKTVGVFVNAAMKELMEAPVDILQLHGDETPKDCERIRSKTNKRIWKVIPMKDDAALLPYEAYLPFVDGFLFDTAGANRGGNGIAFRWESQRQTWESIEKQVLVAGGITKKDLKQLKTYPIDGVDVSSGVEIDGKKSVDKIIQFIEEART